MTPAVEAMVEANTLLSGMVFESGGFSGPTRDDIRKVAEATTADRETIHATWFPVTAEMVESANQRP